MADVKFTAGPWGLEHPERDWSVDSDTAPGTVAVTICADNRIDPVCIVVEPMSHGDEKRLDANAHLIAASPDLYETGKLLADATEAYFAWLEEGRAPYVSGDNPIDRLLRRKMECGELKRSVSTALTNHRAALAKAEGQS